MQILIRAKEIEVSNKHAHDISPFGDKSRQFRDLYRQ